MPNVSLVDPKYIDGDPWDVAKVAGEQSIQALELTEEALEGFFWAARGAWMTQEHYRTDEMPDIAAFEDSPLGKKLYVVLEAIKTLKSPIETATKAASFDPRSF